MNIFLKVRLELPYITQTDMGNLVGVSNASVSQYERGCRMPYLIVIKRYRSLAKSKYSKERLDKLIDHFVDEECFL